jgi:hypothetical protein
MAGRPVAVNSPGLRRNALVKRRGRRHAVTDGYRAVLPFDVDDPEFVRGVEVGMLWAYLQVFPERRISQTCHATNTEMIIRMSEALNRKVACEIVTDIWIDVLFQPKEQNDV